jgi:hypothetical protein
MVGCPAQQMSKRSRAVVARSDPIRHSLRMKTRPPRPCPVPVLAPTVHRSLFRKRPVRVRRRPFLRDCVGSGLIFCPRCPIAASGSTLFLRPDGCSDRPPIQGAAAFFVFFIALCAVEPRRILLSRPSWLAERQASRIGFRAIDVSCGAMPQKRARTSSSRFNRISFASCLHTSGGIP